MSFSVLGFFSLMLVSSFSPLWLEKILSLISIFLNLLRLVLCLIMWSIFKIVPSAFAKNVYFGSLGWKALYIYQLSPYGLGHCSMLQYMLIFCLEDLSFFDSGVLKSPTIIVLLSISFLKSFTIFFMYLGAPLLGVYKFTMFLSSWWIQPLSIMKWSSLSLFIALLLKSILSDMSIATLLFFRVLSLENLFPALPFQSV